MAKKNSPASKKRAQHPRIIALVSTKGGTGKSTLAACLAGELSRRGVDVALLDADPQRTLTAWHGNDGPLKAVPIGSANGASVIPSIKSMAEQHSALIVDTAGFNNRDTLSALTLADLALVPFAPTPADAMGTAQTVRLLSDVNSTVERASNPVGVALVMTSAGRGTLVSHMRREVGGIGARMLDTVIGRRVAFAEAFLEGSAPCWMGSTAKPAADEIAALADEIGF